MAEKKSKKFLYEEVKDKLINLILEREMEPQDILPSESEISEMCDVSKMTVKLALNYLEEEGVIYRLARRGSFLSSDYKEKIELMLKGASGSSEILPDVKIMALVVPSVDFYIGRIITAIVNEAENTGWSVVVRVAADESQKEDNLLRNLSSMKNVKGIILFPVDREGCGPELLRLKLEKFPLVIIDRSFKEVSFDCVSHDNYDGAFKMMEFLIDQGHRNIGFLSPVIQTAGSREERYQGYLHSLMEKNVPIRNNYICYNSGTDHSEKGPHVLKSPLCKDLEKYLKDNSDMTAVFCSDDYLAIELYYAAVRLGMNVPEDLSIVGFSDNRVLRYIPILMTTVGQPVTEMAENAVDLLVKRIADPDREVQDIKLATDILKRESVKQLI